MTLNASSRSKALRRRTLLATAILCGLGSALPASAQVKSLEILVPAAPGGGWDQTARAMEKVLQQDQLATRIQVENIPGAGGTIGLAQFVSSKKGKGNALMTGGSVMMGAIITNKSPISLDNVTPLARLTGEYGVLVVTADAPIKSVQDLVAKLKTDPGSVSWGGGSAGGTDQILAGLIAKSAGVEATKVNYIAHGGGGEALSSILGGHVTVGVSGWQEFAPQVAAGKLRAIGIAAPERVPGIDVPTLKEQGVDVELVNWRAVFAPPGIKDKDLATLSAMVEKMVKSAGWQEVLKERSWLDLYQPHDQFVVSLKEEGQSTATVLQELGLVK
jgi:putative tricarboxylic transport membrane protein